ncbi:MAG TPA: prolipoprotein diacylglyceryl transferase, partial [Gemmatimonadales bacterium]|nr:prolipoprotein diacylglyceryl transferase [Gemmatimonadales bacterium]
PWAVAFPEGAPPSVAGTMSASFGVPMPEGATTDTLLAVHPTQLYEVIIMLGVFAVLWNWRRKERGTGWLFGAYLMFAGAERFGVEFLRAKDDRFLGALTYAQGTSLVLILVGAVVWATLAPRPAADPGPVLRKVGRAG